MAARHALMSVLAGLLLASVLPAFAIDTTSMPTPELQARYSSLTHELRCMQCQNQSIADSPVGLASDLRAEVRDMLLAGRSDDDIRDFMVARYGEFILFRPKFSARNAWLWLLPGVLVALGVFVALRVVRTRSRMVAADDELIEDELERSPGRDAHP